MELNFVSWENRRRQPWTDDVLTLKLLILFNLVFPMAVFVIYIFENKETFDR